MKLRQLMGSAVMCAALSIGASAGEGQSAPYNPPPDPVPPDGVVLQSPDAATDEYEYIFIDALTLFLTLDIAIW